jgi:hypothetical protein
MMGLRWWQLAALRAACLLQVALLLLNLLIHEVQEAVGQCAFISKLA